MYIPFSNIISLSNACVNGFIKHQVRHDQMTRYKNNTGLNPFFPDICNLMILQSLICRNLFQNVQSRSNLIKHFNENLIRFSTQTNKAIQLSNNIDLNIETPLNVSNTSDLKQSNQMRALNKYNLLDAQLSNFGSHVFRFFFLKIKIDSYV